MMAISCRFRLLRAPVVTVLQCLLLASHHHVILSFAPQPVGLSPECIASLAHQRYQTANNTDDDHHHRQRRRQQPMHGKVAVITGAAGGIGRELCHIVHNLGGAVVALDRNVTGLIELSASLLNGHEDNNTASSRLLTLTTHHEDLASIAASAREIESKFSNSGIHLLINNAGMTYPPNSEPGHSTMKSAHGKDLAFTVNYLSHFLLTEILLPILSASNGRIVHITSTYHWKVDGTELLPSPPSGRLGSRSIGPIACQSNPSLQGPKHIKRSYANTKLAQLWHSRSIQGCESVCACPTWAGTGIGGEESRQFLETMAFPVAGAGITSAINAMFRSKQDLSDALNDGKSLVANSRTLEYIPKTIWTSKWATNLGWRDGITDFLGLVLLLGQRFTYNDLIIQKSSPESYNNKEGRDAFHHWSLKEVEQWL